MKICLVCDTKKGLHPVWSGAEQVCESLADMLGGMGHEVIYLTVEQQRGEEMEKVYPVRLYPRNITQGSNVTSMLSFLSVYSILKKTKPDIVHIHAKALFLPVFFACKVQKIPIAYTVLDYNLICPNNTVIKPDGSICETAQHPGCGRCMEEKNASANILKKVIRGLYFRMRYLIYKAAAGKIDAVITLSHASKARLINASVPESNIRVIYHYQPRLQEIPEVPLKGERPLNILFVGALYPHKGGHIVVEAMKYVAKEVPEAMLRIIGTGNDKEYKNRIDKIIRNNNLGNNIEFLGHLENEKVFGVMKSCGLVFVPEQWPNEFGPVILVEAMSLGKIVVASHIGATSEFIEHGVSGFLVPHSSARAFADQAVYIYNNKELESTMGKKAKESIQHISQNLCSRDIQKLYSIISR
ncbi:MAG: glycosyltransferase family 4 protein [bacterium]